MKFSTVTGWALAASLVAGNAAAQAPTVDEAKSIAPVSYVHGNSLVSVEMSRKVNTNVEKRWLLVASIDQQGALTSEAR